MKELKDFINESIWDIDDKIEDDNSSILIEKDVLKFIKSNYSYPRSDKFDFIFDKKKNKCIVNYQYKLSVVGSYKYLTNDLFEWGEVGGDFKCTGCRNLETLEGAPKRVGGNFNCSGCHSLETLKGAPEEVGGNFECEYCRNLETLEGAPQEVGGYFNCQRCKILKSLDGIGKVEGKIYSDFH